MQNAEGTWVTEAHELGQSAISFKVERLLHAEKSPYQTIEIYQSAAWGNIMVLDGCLMVTTRDNFLYHEMMSHPALFTHPRAKRVCIIGGGDCGTLREVLRHEEVEQAIQIEIDERVTRLAEKYFPELCEANEDPRAQLLFEDGIRWMAEADPDSLDVVIVDSTDPVGMAEGLFNREFYQTVLKALRPGGILVQQSEAPLLHAQLIASMRTQMKGAGFHSMKTLCFPQPCYPTGWWSATMARKGVDLNAFRERGAATKKFPTRYYNVDTHRGALALPEFLREALEG